MAVRCQPLVDTSTRFIWNMLLGKPDPKQVCSLYEETRGRVVQSAQKGDDCWYYVMNELRIRIGKHPDSPPRAREIEKLCSSLRKKLQQHRDSLREAAVGHWADPDYVKTLQEVTLSIAQDCAQKPEQYKQGIAELDGGWEYLLEFVEKGGHENFHDFLFEKRVGRDIEIIKEFLQTVSRRQELFPEDLEGKNVYAFACLSIEEPTISEWSLQRQRQLYYITMHKVCAALYGLQQSQLDPESGFDGLMKELKEKGPLYSAGYFGTFFYRDLPTLREKVEGREIYAWSKGAERKPETNMGHAVLLIGVEKIGEKGFVFFTDPRDRSDPQDFSSRKIYKISFENFAKHSVTLEGFQPGGARPIRDERYFYYGPRLQTDPPFPFLPEETPSHTSGCAWLWK